MNRFKVLFLIAILSWLFVSNVNAVDHILIFRNSGTIESIEADKLISIELTELDEKGDTHEKLVSQIFKMKTNSLVIPIADIDSVVFGDKNIIVTEKGARRILESELPYISNYDGAVLTYNSSSPSEAIPSIGEKVYYDAFCDIFPFGLCGEVTSKITTSTGYELNIKELPPSEVFKEYIVTGDFDYQPEGTNTRAEFSGGFNFDSEFDISPVRFGSRINGSLSFRNFVGSPTMDYYSADIYLGNEIGLNINIHSDVSGKFELESPSLTVAKGTIAGVLYPQLDLSLFCDLEAMLSLGVKLKRSPTIHYRWIRENGENSFQLITDDILDNEGGNDDEATLDILLEGTVHLGLKADLSLNTLFNRAGAGIRAKIGPEFKGEFGAGIVSKMTEEYTPEYFARANITTSLLASMETYLYHLENIIMGDRIETPLPFSSEIRFLERTHRLLPEFNTRAVRINDVVNDREPSISEVAIDIASTTNDKIFRDIEIGFCITDKENLETVGSAFGEKFVESKSEETQGFNLKIPYSGDIDKIEARPVLKYNNQEILCKPVAPIEGASINGIFSTSGASSSFFVGGAPVIDQIKSGNTTLIVGNIMPISYTNPVFKRKHTFSMITFIGDDGVPSGVSDTSIFGSWGSEEENISLKLSPKPFESIYNGENCTAVLNEPQAGTVILEFNDNRSLILRICEVTSDSLSIAFKNSKNAISLKRQF